MSHSNGHAGQRQFSEPNPLQKALEDYHVMEDDRDRAVSRVAELAADNAALLAEVNMLREELGRADADRVRLQAISGTLLGRLLAINDTIVGAVRASIKDGIEASRVENAETEMEHAAGEAAGILQRVQPQEPIPTPATPMAAPEPPQGRGTPTPPIVDWSEHIRGNKQDGV